MFVVAAFFSCLGPLTMGISLDKWGPRASSLISITLEGIGFALFGASSKDKFPMFIPAMCLIALGGPGVLNATIHLSNLFPAWRATATACMTGSFQISFLVFLGFDELWSQYKLSYSILFTAYSGVCLVNALISLLVWPDVPFHASEVEAILVESGETTPRSKRRKVHSNFCLLVIIMNFGCTQEFLSSLKLPTEFIYHPRMVRRSSSFSSFHTVRSLEEGRRTRSTDDLKGKNNNSNNNNNGNGYYGAMGTSSTTPFTTSSSQNTDGIAATNQKNFKRVSPFEMVKCVKSSTEVDIKDKPFFEQVSCECCPYLGYLSQLIRWYLRNS